MKKTSIITILATAAAAVLLSFATVRVDTLIADGWKPLGTVDRDTVARMTLDFRGEFMGNELDIQGIAIEPDDRLFDSFLDALDNVTVTLPVKDMAHDDGLEIVYNLEMSSGKTHTIQPVGGGKLSDYKNAWYLKIDGRVYPLINGALVWYQLEGDCDAFLPGHITYGSEG